MFWVLLLLLYDPLTATQPLNDKIEAIITSTPAARNAFWGIRIVDLATGEMVFKHNDDRLFMPASNVKLFTTAAALFRLGPEHRFQTRVTADRLPDGSGRICGDVVLVGGGDPTLSAREVPYRKGGVAGDPFRPIEELAAQVVAKGVRRVEGNIVGDDTAFMWEPYPDGWNQDDLNWEYGAPVSALTVGDSSQTLTVLPGMRPLDAARLVFSPPLEYYAVDNRVTTIAQGQGRIKLSRTHRSGLLRLSGSISAGVSGRSFLIAIDDPALFAAMALHDALTRRGIAVTGQGVARHHYGDGLSDTAQAPRAELASRTSPPLLESLRILNKVSQNLQAEMVLRAIAASRGKPATLKSGLDEIEVFLSAAGISKGSCDLADGSGLSRLNLVTPSAITRLLKFMAECDHSEQWLSLFPVAGEDGTLGGRFRGVRGANRIRAKTGSLEHVGALAGYAEIRPGHRLAFSILVNNFSGAPSEIRSLIDKIGAAILQ